MKWEQPDRDEVRRMVKRFESFVERLFLDWDGLRVSATMLGCLEIIKKLDLPGNMLEIPAYLFAIGQTGRITKEIVSDKSEIKPIYKIPKYIRRAFKFTCPWGSAFSLSYGIEPEYAATIPACVYILSELLLSKAERFIERLYDKHQRNEYS